MLGLGIGAEINLLRHFSPKLMFYAEDADVSDCFQKSEFVMKKFLQPLKLAAADCLFVDDAIENCEDVSEGTGASVLHVTSEDGMGADECGKVRLWALGHTTESGASATSDGRLRNTTGAQGHMRGLGEARSISQVDRKVDSSCFCWPKKKAATRPSRTSLVDRMLARKLGLTVEAVRVVSLVSL
jgi:hypothetical protein